MKLQKENIERIYSVVRHIEKSIDKELSLEELAELACFSPFHFQRMFKQVLGETPKQFIKRLRLEEAARIISFQPEKSILDVAFELGFQSLEAFSRAFKDYYLISPDKYKKASEIERIHITQTPYKNKAIEQEPAIELSFAKELPGFETLALEIVSNPIQKCVYLQTTMDSPLLIQESFHRLSKWAQARDIQSNETIHFGYIKDYPIFTPLEKCRYLSCIGIPSEVATSGLVTYLEIPNSKYVKFLVEGTLADIIKTSSFVVHSWLPTSGFKLKLEPILQIPLNKGETPNFIRNIFHIYIPVQPI